MGCYDVKMPRHQDIKRVRDAEVGRTSGPRPASRPARRVENSSILYPIYLATFSLPPALGGEARAGDREVASGPGGPPYLLSAHPQILPLMRRAPRHQAGPHTRPPPARETARPRLACLESS